MSGEKTEQPTKKKLRDSAKEGQSYKSRDIVAACILAAGMLYMASMSFSGIGSVFEDFLTRGNNINPAYAGAKIFELFLQLSLPIVGVCIVATIIPSLLQSKFALAFEAIKIDFNALNPVSGFEKIFSMKTVKEFIKALLYLMVFSAVTYLFYNQYRNILYSLVYAQPSSIANIWLEAGTVLVLLCLASFMLIIILDGIVDYYLYIKNLKMEKHEVKQEYKEQEGSPEVKHRRREVHQEILSGQVKNNIEQSDFILANPTHIAIGIYNKPEVFPFPFISVLARNQRALMVIKYAEKVGTPVIRDIPLARRIFKDARLNSFILGDRAEPIFRILQWLKEVEIAHLKDIGEEVDTPAESEEVDGSLESKESVESQEPQESQENQESQETDELQESHELQRNLWLYKNLRKHSKDSLEASKESQGDKEPEEPKAPPEPKDPPA
jgi:type III secretion protein U